MKEEGLVKKRISVLSYEKEEKKEKQNVFYKTIYKNNK